MAESKIENIEILAAIGFGFTMLFYAFDAVNTFNTDKENKIGHPNGPTSKYDVWLIADPTLNSLELWLSGVVLFITGIFEALNEKVMDANICIIYSSFWITTWFFSSGKSGYSTSSDDPTMDELGLFHLLFLIIAAVFAIAKLKSKKIELACHGAFAVFLLFMVIFYFTKEKVLLRIAGIFGFIDAAVWWYLGFGSLINEGMGDIVPMF